jgi:hypothetical protein
VQERHRERLAVVYVRRSTVQYVEQHRESTQIHYGLVHLAEPLGWARERIRVIDDDLRVSGASSEGRVGFQRLLGEIPWDHVGRIHRNLMERYERFVHEQPRLLSSAEQEQVRALASDLPALWNAPTTTDADRKTILRQIIDKVAVEVEGGTEWVEARVHWTGGQQTYTRFRRPVARLEQFSTRPQVRDRITQLKRWGDHAPAIAEQLDRERLRPPNGKRFTAQCVRTWLSRMRLILIGRSHANDKR